MSVMHDQFLGTLKAEDLAISKIILQDNLRN